MRQRTSNDDNKSVFCWPSTAGHRAYPLLLCFLRETSSETTKNSHLQKCLFIGDPFWSKDGVMCPILLSALGHLLVQNCEGPVHAASVSWMWRSCRRRWPCCQCALHSLWLYSLLLLWGSQSLEERGLMDIFSLGLTCPRSFNLFMISCYGSLYLFTSASGRSFCPMSMVDYHEKSFPWYVPFAEQFLVYPGSFLPPLPQGSLSLGSHNS